jgi:hypothetical protein
MGGGDMMDGVTGNIGSAMSMASTGLLVMGAAVPLGMMKNMANSSATTKKKRKKKSKKGRK